MLLALLALLASAAFRALGEMEVTLAEAMPGPLLPPCENKEIPLEEAGAPGLLVDGHGWECGRMWKNDEDENDDDKDEDDEDEDDDDDGGGKR